MAGFDRRIKDFLFRREVMSKEALEEHSRKAEEGRISFTEQLIKNAGIKEEAILAAICKETGYTPICLDRFKFDRDLVNLIPQEAAETYGALILSRIGSPRAGGEVAKQSEDTKGCFLTVAVADPLDVTALDDLKRMTGSELLTVVTTGYSLQKNIQRAYRADEMQAEKLMQEIKDSSAEGFETIAEAAEDDVDISSVTNEDSPVVKLVNMIITKALEQGASDIHIEPFEKYVRLRYRVDGACRESELAPPKRMASSVVSRIKIMSEMDIAERRKPQDGKFRLRYQKREVDFRVSVLPVVHGEKVVMRVLDSSSLTLNLLELGFEPKALEDFRNACNAAYGMVLVTGPTGSGKSTTLYSAIREVLNVEDNIVTVEEPVEYQLDGVNQVPVNPKRGLTFAAALRSILRQDPDTVMIGEIRDLETAEIAIKAALTGHLVFSTLHTNDAPSTVTRLVDMGIDPFMVSSALILVSAQRLGRKLCKNCKLPTEIPVETLIKLGAKEVDIQTFGTSNIFKANPKGCERCSHGYKGRFAMLETMPMTESLQRIVVSRGSALDLKKAALEEGMITLRRVGVLNVLKGITSMENVLSITLGD
jgi:type IV pilus assembly protein PilB